MSHTAALLKHFKFWFGMVSQNYIYILKHIQRKRRDEAIMKVCTTTQFVENSFK